MLPAVRSAVLVVTDGLGAIPLRAHAAHARTLTSVMGKRDVAASVFPTTTAAALTSLLTGVAPGVHGLVGYRVRHGNRLINQLSDWEKAGIDPFTWQQQPTIFEQARSEGRPAFAVGIAKYAASGFTKATLRGAEFVPAKTPEERVAAAWGLAEDNPGALVYCYLPEVDKAGHAHGIDSGEWVAALEDIDGAIRQRVPDDVGVLVTSDHGMIDVPAHRHIVLDPSEGWHEGVALIGGEPRMLHVYGEPDADIAEISARWQRQLGDTADVVIGSDIDALYGGVDSAAHERIGDFLVVARGNRAFYDGEDSTMHGRGMVGQHGAITPEEWQVPYLRFGGYAK